MMGKTDNQIQLIVLDIDSMIPQNHLLRQIKKGLLISAPGFLNEGVPERIEKEPYIQNRFELYNQLPGGARITVSGDCDIISIDSYGRYFIDVCMPKKEIENNAN